MRRYRERMQLLTSDDPRRRALEALPLRTGGVTAVDVAPPRGMERMEVGAALPGRSLAELTEELLTGQVQKRAGLHVAATSARLQVGTRLLMTLRLGPLRIGVPCEVVEVREEQGLASFTYATLAGHPEKGLERFTVIASPGSEPELRITAVSAPALWWSRLGRPVSRLMQRRITARYLAALRTRTPEPPRR